MSEQTQLQGRELDMTLAKALGHQVEWQLAAFIEGDVVFDLPESNGYISKQTPVIVGSGEPQLLPRYSTDLNAMHQVEAEIGKRGLQERYGVQLMRDVQIVMTGDELVMDKAYDVWLIAHASAEQKARAALAVLKVTQP